MQPCDALRCLITRIHHGYVAGSWSLFRPVGDALFLAIVLLQEAKSWHYIVDVLRGLAKAASEIRFS